MLIGMLSMALAADSWTATCSGKNDPSVWFVISSAADAAPLPEFDCAGLFFDSTVACTQTVALGKIRPSGTSPGGIPLLELRYLPYGTLPTVMSFLNQPGNGVEYKLPATAATTYAATPVPSTASELLSKYLMQRNKASAATQNVTLHVWSCPEANFTAPMDAIEPFGMTYQAHVGRVSMY